MRKLGGTKKRKKKTHTHTRSEVLMRMRTQTHTHTKKGGEIRRGGWKDVRPRTFRARDSKERPRFRHKPTDAKHNKKNQREEKRKKMGRVLRRRGAKTTRCSCCSLGKMDTISLYSHSVDCLVYSLLLLLPLLLSVHAWRSAVTAQPHL